MFYEQGTKQEPGTKLVRKFLPAGLYSDCAGRNFPFTVWVEYDAWQSCLTESRPSQNTKTYAV